MSEATKLYRTREDRIIGGVLGGLGKYFGVDPTIFRLVFVAVTIFSGLFPGAVLYIIALFLVPKEKHVEKSRSLQTTVIEVGPKKTG